MEYYTDKGRDGQDKQEKTCCKTQHVKIDMKRDASIIICRMAAVGENYKLTRDRYMNVTSAEIDKSSGMEFYINVSEVSDAWIEVIQKAVYIDRFNNKEANRYGADWCDAGVNTLTRLHVTINPGWKVSIRLEVYYEDKEKDYMFGTVYFKVNIADDVALKEIIVDAIRSRLFQ